MKNGDFSFKEMQYLAMAGAGSDHVPGTGVQV